MLLISADLNSIEITNMTLCRVLPFTTRGAALQSAGPGGSGGPADLGHGQMVPGQTWQQV